MATEKSVDLTSSTNMGDMLDQVPQASSISVLTEGSLPISVNSLLGRDQDVERICYMLRHPDVRLVTLNGVGGVGKTRLALEVAKNLSSAFPDGCIFVDLAPLRTSELIISVLATALGITDTDNQLLPESVATYLRPRRLLILLDNFEHVLEGAPWITTLLAAAPGLKVLVTSRAMLRLSGERVVTVAPLDTPAEQSTSLEEIRQSSAVQLFVDRAQAIQADFTLTPENAAAISAICRHLDGLPLAIELASARVPVLPPNILHNHIQRRLPLLNDSVRDAPSRQQSMWHTIAWSYALLDVDAQVLLARLSVFNGHFTPETAAAVCFSLSDDQVTLTAAGNNADSRTSASLFMLDQLEILVRQSMLVAAVRDMPSPRFLMLETIREFALEALTERGEAELYSRRHAAAYLALAEHAEQQLRSAYQQQWLDRLDADYHQLRAALEWSLAHDSEIAARLGGALGFFWEIRGYLSEGRRWLNDILARDHTPLLDESNGKSEAMASYVTARRAARAKALQQVGRLATAQGDLNAAREANIEALALAQQLNDSAGIIFNCNALGIITMTQCDYPASQAYFALCLDALRTHNDVYMRSKVLYNSGTLAFYQSNFQKAAHLFNQSLELNQANGDTRGIAFSLASLGDVYAYEGAIAQAQQSYEESIRLLRTIGDTIGLGLTLCNLGILMAQTNEVQRAYDLLKESEHIFQQSQAPDSLTLVAEGFAVLLAGTRQPALAARLYGAAAQARERYNSPMSYPEAALHTKIIDTIRKQIGEEAATAATVAGRAMTLDDALNQMHTSLRPETLTTAHAAPMLASSTTPHTTLLSASLTSRELEVLQLLAQGLTNIEIAHQLVLSPRTIDAHLRSIFTKIEVTSRSAATRYAVEHNLV